MRGALIRLPKRETELLSTLKDEAMRVIVGAIVVLGLVVTVAVAQPPAQRERAAVLKPPQPLAPDELPLVARGVADDLPPSGYLQSTPVTRSRAMNSGAVTPTSAWLRGVDPNVIPASGTVTRGNTTRPYPQSPAAMTNDTRGQPSMRERLRGVATGQKPPAQQPGSQQPTASTPFRGTSSNGAPVYAGPPAYRWYGWGTITPGANPLAPAGQYPRASANWYSITGATPGAFPVPVSNAPRPEPGMEPPSYGLARTIPAQPPAPVVPVMS